MYIKFLLSILLGLSGTQAFATLINANDFSVGTDISHIDPTVSLSWLHSTGNIADPIQSLPVSIDSSAQSPERYFVGASHSLTSGIRINPNYGAPLDELKSYQPFDALLVSFAAPTTQFGFKAENMSGDGIWMFLYDEHKQSIAIGSPTSPYGIPLAPDFSVYTGASPPAVSHYNYFAKSFDFAVDVSYILFGGWDSSTYLYEISSSVPEPGIFLMFSVGLAALAIGRTRKIIT